MATTICRRCVLRSANKMNNKYTLSVLQPLKRFSAELTSPPSCAVRKETSNVKHLNAEIVLANFRSVGGLGGSFRAIIEKTRIFDEHFSNGLSSCIRIDSEPQVAYDRHKSMYMLFKVLTPSRTIILWIVSK